MKIESKRRKVSIKAASVHGGKQKQFKCDICNAEFGRKGNLNKHVAKAVSYTHLTLPTNREV